MKNFDVNKTQLNYVTTCFAFLILLVGCNGGNSAQNASSAKNTSGSASMSANAFCYLPNHSRDIQIQDFFKTCLHPGMSHLDVSNVMGNQGTKISTSRNTTIYHWKWPGGKLLNVHFEQDKLVTFSITSS